MVSNCRHCGVEGEIDGPITPNEDGEYTFRCNRCAVKLWKVLVWDTYRGVGTPMLAGALISAVLLGILDHPLSPASRIMGGLGFYAVLVLTPLFWAWKLKLLK